MYYIPVSYTHLLQYYTVMLCIILSTAITNGITIVTNMFLLHFLAKS